MKHGLQRLIEEEHEQVWKQKNEIHESNELIRYEKLPRNKFNDELKLELSSEVYRKRVELLDSNEFSSFERDESKQKDEASKAVRK